MSVAHIQEQRSPYRHILGAVRGMIGVAANRGRVLLVRILPAVVLGQRGQVGGRNLQRAGCWTSTFAVRPMADCTVGGEHLLAGCGRGLLDRNMLDDFWWLTLGLVLRSDRVGNYDKGGKH